MKLICACALVLGLLGCLVDAQYGGKKGQEPKRPPPVQQKPTIQRPTYQRPTQQQQTQYDQKGGQIPQPPATETFHSCEVHEQEKILCGPTGIGASDCSAINCCFDGRKCFYGKAVTLQCTKDAQMIVVVARDATLPNIDLETISFLGEDQRCNPVGTTSAFAIYQFPVTACGTVVMEEPGILIYENRMSSSYEVLLGPNGRITRDSSYELLVQCRYIGTTVEALVIEVGSVPPPPPVAAPGPLRVELLLGNGVCTAKGCAEVDVAYTSFYQDTDYPVTKVLRDPVYVQVHMLERTDPNLVLTLGRCWATANPNPLSLPQWDLLIDGCPYVDDRYMTSLVPVDASSGLAFPTHHRRFVFKMFTFVAKEGGSEQQKIKTGKGSLGGAADVVLTPLDELVYIHCDVAVCLPSMGNNCEPRCFRKKRDIAASVIRAARAETTVVSSKGIIMREEEDALQ
ncbi:zona pellucida sperm-binding protein 4-like [Aulostomus maculatus]